MVHLTEDFQGCEVIIFNDEGDHIIKTVITMYDKRARALRIQEELRDIKKGDRLNILITYQGGVSEFSGTAGGTINFLREIFLFNVRRREGRGATRHPINTPAVIKNLYDGRELVPLPSPLDVTLLDISKTGILIKAPVGHFGLGDTLELHINIKDKDRETIIYVTVMRTEPIDIYESHFGCKYYADR